MTYIPIKMGEPDGVAQLDNTGKVPSTQLPAGGGSVSDATTTAKGIVQLSGDIGGTAASPTVPGLAGKASSSHTHDYAATTHNHDSSYALTAHGHTELPTAGQKAGLAGTTGTPGDTNRYVTNSDTRLSDARTPTSHTHTKSQVTDFAHTHPASELTATGTASTTTFLRGDNTWATPAGGGGNDTRILVARKSANQAITDTVLRTDVAGMVLTLEATSTYYVNFAIPVTTSTGTSPTISFGFTGPITPALVSLRRSQMTSATAVAFAVITSFTNFALAASVANIYHIIEGVVVTGATGGNIQLNALVGGTTPSITIPAGASAYAIKTA